jgi:hypothetical protein
MSLHSFEIIHAAVKTELGDYMESALNALLYSHFAARAQASSRKTFRPAALQSG